MKYSEKWGDSVDLAVELALADLKLTREQVDIIVLEESTKGFFGIGSKLAKVRVEEKAEKTVQVEKQAENIVEKQTEKIVEKKPERKVEIKREGNQEILIEVCGMEEPNLTKFSSNKFNREDRKDRPRRESRERDNSSRKDTKGLNERPTDLREENNHIAKTFLTDVTKEMGLIVNVRVFTNDLCLYIDIEGEDSGTIIGKRGQTLDAIQYLTSLVVNKGKDEYVRVVIDAEGYRDKREKTLEKLANRLADKAKKSGRSVRLEPMNPYERKVIHTALQERPEVTTKSEGEEPYRRVVIEPSK